MLEGEYKSNRYFSPEQREADEDHGIYQVQNRTLTFSAPNTFKYAYHYYYQYEAGYVMREQRKNDTVFSGTYIIDGNSVVLTITAGEQVACDEVAQKDLSGKSNITGSITFEREGQGLKVASAKMNLEKMDRSNLIILQGSTFTKA